MRAARAISSRLPARSDPPGRAEPLGERDRDEFERRGEPVSTPSPLATAAFQSRAPSRKVAMPRSRAAAQMRPPRPGEDDAAGAVVRVLDLDEGRRRVDAVVARLDRGDELRRREDAARADLGELHAGVRCRAAGLVPDRVALAADDHVVAGPRQDAQRHLVGHRAARQPERGLLAQQRGDRVLEPVDRRVLAVLVVADGRRRHRRAHLGRRPGDGVGAQVDRGSSRGLPELPLADCRRRPLPTRVPGARLDDLREATAVARRLQVLVEHHSRRRGSGTIRPS
jgi:hypothetical protein